MTKHEDDYECGIEVQTLTTATCYSNSWTLNQKVIKPVEVALDIKINNASIYLAAMSDCCFNKENDVDSIVEGKPYDPGEIVSEVV